MTIPTPERDRTDRVKSWTLRGCVGYDIEVSARRGPDAASRLPPSRKDLVAEERVSTLATRLLRERPDWQLTSASFSQNWALTTDGELHRVEAYVTAFLGAEREPATIISLKIRSNAATRARLLSAQWVRALRTRLGRGYVLNEPSELRPELCLTHALRGTMRPFRVLRALERVCIAVEARAPVRTSRLRESGSRATHDGARLWTIIDALRGGPWHLESSTHRVERKIRRDGGKWNLSAIFKPHIHGIEPEAGFVGMLQVWPAVDRPRSNATFAAEGLSLVRRAGYRVHRDHGLVHSDRLHRGLALGAAKREIELLEHAVRLIERRPG